jgi:N-acetylglucosamine-6-phosphate deacetylase
MTNRFLIHNAHVFSPAGDWQPGWLLTEDRQIYAMGPGFTPDFEAGRITRRIDAGGQRLLPGLIDLHVHGAMGFESMDASPDGLREMARYYARHGVTGFLATTWTASGERILAAVQTIAQVYGEIPGGAALLGVHLEGPYLNPVKCGAQDARLIRRAERSEALGFLDAGPVRLLALAPEFPENLWLIDECVRRGIAVAAGHTTAGLPEMQLAVAHGVRQVTHCFNGMQGFGHRDLGTVGAAMALPEVNCELIADNIHVHPAAQKILVDVKGCDGVILITDAIRGTGMPDGEYPMDDRTVTIRDGQVRLPGGALAGSVLTLERGLGNVLANTDRSLQEAWRMSSLNAARAIGVSARKGSLEPGKDADLVLLDGDFNVALTVVEGQVAYENATQG